MSSLAMRLTTLERRLQKAQAEAPRHWWEDDAFLATLPAPLFAYLCDATAHAGWLATLAGDHYRHALVSLRGEQRRLLMAAEYRYGKWLAAANGWQPYSPGWRHGNEWDRRREEDLYGGRRRPYAVWEDLSGAAWVTFWRAHRTSEPAILAAAGLGTAELALLDAD